MKKIQIKLVGGRLGWFNTWFGFLWLIAFIPSFLYFFNHNLFLNTRFSKEVIAEYRINIDDNRSRMIIETNRGVFNYHNDIFFDTIITQLKVANYIEIWYNKENRAIVNIRINKSHFIISRSKLANRLYLFALLLSGFMLALSITLIIKTKGWGSYELLEKYPEGLWKKLSLSDYYDWHKRR